MSAAPSQRAARPLVTLRFVFRGTRGIVREAARPLAPGDTIVGRLRDGDSEQPVLTLVDDQLASRRHALLRYKRVPPSLEVTDTESRNGVRVNGQRVAQAQLVDGDVLRLGASIAVVRFEDPTQLDVPSEVIAGPSPAMQQVRVAVARMSRASASVLITGETGVGKEVVARALHDAAGTRGPFVAVNCTAMTEALADSLLFGHVAGAFTGAAKDHDGFFRAAHGGTLLLDEIGDMPEALQPKLLRTLETRTVTPVGTTKTVPFEARVLAATNAVDEDGDHGSLREDLYARLAQLHIHIEPLRERREDVLILLAPHIAGLPPLSPELADKLCNAPWRRNVREVLAVAAELRVWGADKEQLDGSLLPERMSGVPASGDEQPGSGPGEASPSRAAAPVPDAAQLEMMLRDSGGNVAAVAKMTGRSRAQVYRWLTRYGLSADDYRDDSE